MDKNIFISYRRDTGSTLARLVYDRFRIEKKWNAFLDVEELAAGDFRKAIREKMRSCDVFVLILSKNSLDRCSDSQDNVRQEIEVARQENLAIIPITSEDFEWPRNMPEGLEYIKDYNAIPYIQVYSESCFNRLYDFIEGVRKRNNAIARQKAAAARQKKMKEAAAAAGQALIKKNTSAAREKSNRPDVNTGKKKKSPLIVGILGIIAVLAITFGVRSVLGRMDKTEVKGTVEEREEISEETVEKEVEEKAEETELPEKDKSDTEDTARENPLKAILGCPAAN